MFQASICPSSGVLGCIRIILLHMVFSTVKENCVLVGCRNGCMCILQVWGAVVCVSRCLGVRVLFIIINKLLHQVDISRQFPKYALCIKDRQYNFKTVRTHRAFKQSELQQIRSMHNSLYTTFHPCGVFKQLELQ